MIPDALISKMVQYGWIPGKGETIPPVTMLDFARELQACRDFIRDSGIMEGVTTVVHGCDGSSTCLCPTSCVFPDCDYNRSCYERENRPHSDTCPTSRVKVVVPPKE